MPAITSSFCFVGGDGYHNRAQEPAGYRNENSRLRMRVTSYKRRSLSVAEKKDKFVIYRDMKGGYRWRLRSPTGETVAASEAGSPNKSVCEADLRAFMADHHLDAKVLDATVRGIGR
jgi:hypothetical protein